MKGIHLCVAPPILAGSPLPEASGKLVTAKSHLEEILASANTKYHLEHSETTHIFAFSKKYLVY